MIYGLNEIGGEKIKAVPQSKAFCPSCDGSLISKCGSINIWHWAHEKGSDCDTWSEGETEWHLNWKSRFPTDCTEIQIKRNNVKHRADVCFPNGIIIEFQHSPLSVEEIRERESFYKTMIWVFDIRESRRPIAFDSIPIIEAAPDELTEYDGGIFKEKPVVIGWQSVARYRFDIYNKKDYQTFRWKHAKKSISYARCPVYLDLGEGWLFQVKKMYPNSPVGGSGHLRNKDEFISRLLQRNWN